MIKVKEITIGRSRKWAWDFGNSVGYNISITIEGTTAKDTVEDMRKAGLKALLPLQNREHDRCGAVFDVDRLREEMEFDDKVEKSSGKNNVIKKVLEPVESLPPDSKALLVLKEVEGPSFGQQLIDRQSVDPTSDEIQYDSKTFKKFQPCKYKCGMFTAWGQPYTQGDRKLHMNPLTKEILGYECPAFDEGGS